MDTSYSFRIYKGNYPVVIATNIVALVDIGAPITLNHLVFKYDLAGQAYHKNSWEAATNYYTSTNTSAIVKFKENNVTICTEEELNKIVWLGHQTQLFDTRQDWPEGHEEWFLYSTKIERKNLYLDQRQPIPERLAKALIEKCEAVGEAGFEKCSFTLFACH